MNCLHMQEVIRKNLYVPQKVETKFGKVKIIYADYTASGQPFKRIEKFIEENVYPYYANVHSNAYNGRKMSEFIEKSRNIIKRMLNCNPTDSILFTGSGCSCAITHFIHIINCENQSKKETVVFVTDIEHNSNFLPWRELAVKNITLVIVPVNSKGMIDNQTLEHYLKKYNNFKNKFISFSACSNVIGTKQNIEMICKIGHQYDCFVCFDFAASAPYVEINMHKDDSTGNYIDAVYISPHKFIGGPGTTGLLVFNDKLIKNKCPYYPSGGTTRFSSKNIKIYSNSVEKRESGGTGNILGVIKLGLVFNLKLVLQSYIKKREQEIIEYVGPKLQEINTIKILNPSFDNIIPIYSFIVPNYHYNLIVALLHDLFGIQTRGGVDCNSTLQKRLLKLNDDDEIDVAKSIVEDKGVPKNYGWIRVTFHFSLTNKEIDYIIKAIKHVSKNVHKYINKYTYHPKKNLWL